MWATSLRAFHNDIHFNAAKSASEGVHMKSHVRACGHGAAIAIAGRAIKGIDPNQADCLAGTAPIDVESADSTPDVLLPSQNSI